MKTIVILALLLSANVLTFGQSAPKSESRLVGFPLCTELSSPEFKESKDSDCEIGVSRSGSDTSLKSKPFAADRVDWGRAAVATSEDLQLQRPSTFKLSSTSFSGAVVSSGAETRSKDSDTDNFFKRRYLTGDWGGSRTKLAEKGLTIEASLTQFVQTWSGDRGEGFDYYGNHIDGYVKLNTEKAGFWKGGAFSVHMQIRYGDSPKGVNLYPPVGGLFLPTNGEKKFAVSELNYSHQINESTTIAFGLFDTADFSLNAPFTGGSGLEGFSNLSLVQLPTSVTPPSTWGFRYIRKIKKKYVATFFVHDPQGQYPWRTPFEKGVSFLGSFNAPTRFFGKNGMHAFAAGVSTKKGTNLRDAWQVFLPIEDRIIGTKRGAWSLSYQWDQFLFEKEKDPSQGWGLFAKGQLNDGNPNLINGGILFGLGGKGLIPKRAADRFGVGYFTIWPSSTLRDAVPEIPIQRESGFEAFYNFAATPWLKFTADIQYLPPTIAGFESRVYFGVRTKIDF